MNVDFNDLNTRVVFFSSIPNEGPEPGDNKDVNVYECWAGVDSVWMKDLEQAKSNGTLEDLTLKIRDTRGQFIPNNKHYLSIQSFGFENKRYNVKSVKPDLRDKRFIVVVAGLVS